MLKEEVDAEEIAQIVSRWTGIPVSKLLEGEMEKLVQMEDRLHQRVVGQDEASKRFPTPCGAPVPGCKIPTARLAHSSSWARPAWVKPSWRGPWLNSCSMTTTP